MLTGTWLTVDIEGNIILDYNIPYYADVKIKMIYDSNTYFTNEFKVNVSCPAFTRPATEFVIDRLYKKDQASFGRTNEIIFEYETYLKNYI